MTQESATKLGLLETIPLPTVHAYPKKARTAIKRCCAAWQRAHDAHLEGTSGGDFARIVAVREAGSAYRRAMPPLAGYESIRDFIACTAYGILIDAIPQKRGNQLLYAAQVALASLHYEPKPPKSA
jgi:hypothetical protein